MSIVSHPHPIPGTTHNISPPAPQRIDDLDALRGFALLGILMVNIGAFASAYYGVGLADPSFDGLLDRFTVALGRLLFETKFYLLFSFLFGYSFTLQMESARRAQQPFAPRYLRRSAGLLLLGIGHAILFFHGDILLTYALLGLVLMGLRRLSPRAAIKLSVTLLVVTALCWALVGLLLLGEEGRLSAELIHTEAARATAAYRDSIGTTIGQHIHEWFESVVWILAFVQAPCALAMFLVGLAAAKSKFFVGMGERRGQLWRALLIGAPIGVVGALCYSYLNATPSQVGQSMLGLSIGMLTAPALACAYAAALLLALQRPQGGATLGAWLAPAGRMALTNYLTQSVVCAILFTAWGWGLIGQLAPLAVAAIAVTLYLVQLVVSRWWMRRHAFGPVEWWLRALTHWQWPAWHRVLPIAPPTAR